MKPDEMSRKRSSTLHSLLSGLLDGTLSITREMRRNALRLVLQLHRVDDPITLVERPTSPRTKDDIRGVRQQTVVLASIACLTVLLAYLVLQAQIGTNASQRWLVGASLMLLFEFIVLWRGLSQYQVEDESIPLIPGAFIGFGNIITLARGIAIAFVAGFLVVQPRVPELLWVAGASYTAAIIGDFVDGVIARFENRVTALGSHLDLTIDSIGLFVAVVLGVRYGVLPVWYLGVGISRYGFVAGLWVRRYQSKSVNPLPPRSDRRILAALQMVVVSMALLGVLPRSVTHLIATMAMIPFLARFMYDWGIVTGRFMPDT